MEIEYNFVLSIVGIILAVIGIVQGIKYQRKKIPFFDISSSNFLSNQQSIESKKHGKEVGRERIPNITVTKLGIWNDGVGIIYEQDIPKENPLIIQIDDQFKIFEVDLISKKFEYIKINIRNDQSNIFLNFNYLEKRSWFVIKIKHSGTYIDCFKSKGKVIGGKELKRIPNSSSNSQKYEPIFFDYLALIGGLIILLLVYKYSVNFNLFSVILALPGLTFTIVGGMRIFEIRLPKDLKKELGK